MSADTMALVRMQPPLNHEAPLMRELYVWAHSHEQEVFGNSS